MKRGFTLIELMAVIVVLGILATISIISVDKIIKENKEETYKAQIATIEDAARTWGVKHIKELPDSNGAISVPLLYFKNEGIIPQDFKNPKTNKPFNDDLYVNISYEGGIYKYEVDEASGLGTNANPTLLKRRYSLCKLVNGTKETVGAKYTCHLDSDRTFYVLETSKDNVSLIMDRNFTDATVPSKLAWCIDCGSDGSTCKSINSKEYGTPLKHIQDTFGTDVEVSIPSPNQIAAASGKTFSSGDLISGLSSWLYDYLDGTTHPVSGVLGYWISTTIDSNSSSAYITIYTGNMYGSNVNSSDGGLRPVITVAKSQLQ